MRTELLLPLSSEEGLLGPIQDGTSNGACVGVSAQPTLPVSFSFLLYHVHFQVSLSCPVVTFTLSVRFNTSLVFHSFHVFPMS